MTQTELTRMKVWLIEHAEEYMIYVPECEGNGSFAYDNGSLAKDFYNHFKNEIN